MIACLILLALIGGALGVPIGLAIAIYENAGGGPYFRGIRRANRKAEREYIRSLSPEDRKAYRWHEKRKRQFAQWSRLFWLGKLTPRLERKLGHGPGENFDDVTGAPDSPDGKNPDRNLYDDGPWAPPREWRPPKWRVEQAEP